MKNALNNQSILLLAVCGLFMLSGALSGTFLNVYLWKAKQDFVMIGWFTLTQQLAIGFTSWIVGKWVKERDKMITLRVGIIILGLFYLVVLWSGVHMIHYIIPLGLLFGIGFGMFWLAFNVVYFEVTDADTRDRFNAWVGILSSFIGLFGPWISGWVISNSRGESGYQLVFMISLGIYGISVVLSFWLKKRKTSGTYSWSEPVRQLKKESTWRRVVPASAIHGVREGVFAFLIHLLIYISTSAEWKIGQYTLVTSVVSLVSFWIAGKWLKPKFRYIGMLIGSVFLTAVIGPLLWEVNYFTLIILGIGTSLFMPLYIIPLISSVFDLIGTSSHNVEKRVELIVLRELSITGGRIAGIVLFIIVLSLYPNMTAVTYLMALIGFSPVLTWLVLRKLLLTEKKAV